MGGLGRLLVLLLRRPGANPGRMTAHAARAPGPGGPFLAVGAWRRICLRPRSAAARAVASGMRPWYEDGVISLVARGISVASGGGPVLRRAGGGRDLRSPPGIARHCQPGLGGPPAKALMLIETGLGWQPGCHWGAVAGLPEKARGARDRLQFDGRSSRLCTMAVSPSCV